MTEQTPCCREEAHSSRFYPFPDKPSKITWHNDWKRYGRTFLALLFFSFSLFHLSGAETIPPAPAEYFNDYASLVSQSRAQQFNQQLENFEKETSNQIVVAIYPKMQSDSSIEDYTVRVAQSWHVGQKGKDNGAVLFVFVQDRKMYLQVGYGLEGSLTDALSKNIIENEIKPRFKQGQFAGGLQAGINAILAATKGEYKGTGTTVAEQKGDGKTIDRIGLVVTTLIILIAIHYTIGLKLFFAHLFYNSRIVRYTRYTLYDDGYSEGGLGSSGGSGFSGGSFGSGGGSFGGGGAGGSW